MIRNIPFLIIYIFLSLTLTAQDMNVKPGTKVTIASGAQLNFINSSSLILEDSPSTAPSFLQHGLVNFSSGQAHIEQYLTKDTWNIVSSPVSDGIIEAYEWMYLIYYSESDNSWHYLNKPVNQPLNAGQGYFVWPYVVDPNGTYPASPDSAVIKGNLNYQDINLALANTDASPKSGWNLIGNPFPVALNWNGDASWNLNNVGAAMYIKDPVSGNYVVWNYNTGGSKADSGYIAATQGFWVRTADTTGTAASITLPESQRSHKSAAFYKSSGPFLPKQLLVEVEQEGKSDKTIMGFIEDATVGYDGNYDATYLYGDEDAMSLFSMIGGERYALNHLPSIEEYPVIPVGFIPKKSGNFTLTSEWMESFPVDIPIFLEDKKDNIYQDLRINPEYSFAAELNEETYRFNIHFTNPLGVDNVGSLSGVHIYAYQKTIFVVLPEDLQGEIYVYNMLGEIIAQRETSVGKVNIPVNADNTYLFVKVTSENGLKSGKVFIK
ncbi:MAG: T9SS type A sorting domain-containing protein [Bacteroidales bacterium]